VFTIDTECPNQIFYVWLVDLLAICAKHWLEMWFSSNNDIPTCLLDIRHGWNKNAFWDANNRKWRKWCRFVTPFLPNNTYGLPVVTKDTKFPSHVFYVWLIDLHTIFVKFGLETWFSPNDDICKCLLDMKHGWNINAFWGVNKEKWRKWCVFHISYLITLKAYLCSQCTPNVQIKYFMFDLSIYILFVLNRCCERDPLEIIIFVYVSSTWSIVEVISVLRRE
jgi:hypothetical protein